MYFWKNATFVGTNCLCVKNMAGNATAVSVAPPELPQMKTKETKMELGTTYIVLAYIGPICGIIGFIITPGMTHIRPWLLEKFNKDKKALTEDRLIKNYSTMITRDLLKERMIFKNNYKFDFRKKIRNRRKELNKAIDRAKFMHHKED